MIPRDRLAALGMTGLRKKRTPEKFVGRVSDKTSKHSRLIKSSFSRTKDDKKIWHSTESFANNRIVTSRVKSFHSYAQLQDVPYCFVSRLELHLNVPVLSFHLNRSWPCLSISSNWTLTRRIFETVTYWYSHSAAQQLSWQFYQWLRSTPKPCFARNWWKNWIN